MGYASLADAITDLESHGMLRRVKTPLDSRLEIGVIQRRAYARQGPALLFENVRGSAFPMLANLFGTRDRARFLFRDALGRVEALMRLKADPGVLLKKPWTALGTPRALWDALPRQVCSGPVLERQTTLQSLPQLVSWPMDGGAYVTLPQVYTESPDKPGFQGSNLGMYRVQISGAAFGPDEAGLHYQIHRGIGPHHAQAIAKGQNLPVNIFVGGPPAMTLAAVMPLPEGIPELMFAGALGGRRVEMVSARRAPNGLPMLAQADFCICGYLPASTGPEATRLEGPFGDHLGYYSLAHPFPVMKVQAVYHRQGAVWPFTTVGRPPQEDTVFGGFIHELTAGLVPTVFAGVHEVHAVDVAGVHPLLLAIGSERYVPYAAARQPQELLTNAMALLGTTQTCLSKYVLIAAHEDAPPPAHDIPGFLRHLLERLDLTRDLHFITRTTMDTLDYSGISLNQGSKAVIPACGPVRRTLADALPPALADGAWLPDGFEGLRLFAPGIALVRGPAHDLGRDRHDPRLERLAERLAQAMGLHQPDPATFPAPGDVPPCNLPLLVVVDDPAFAAASWDNFLWVAFTRSDPATDSYGAASFTHCKHWGCLGPWIIDARLKTYHAPPLVPDPEVERRVDSLGVKGGELEGLV